MSETDLVVQNQNPAVIWKNLKEMAADLASSQLIPVHLRGKPADVAIILQMGHELGIGPMQSINGITVIQGKPEVSPQLLIGLIRQRVPGAFIKITEDHQAMSVGVTMARDKGDKDQAKTATWDMARARRMGLDTKDNYKKQPMTMLQWRAVMEAGRFVFPDVLKGLYSPDEVEDIVATENTPDKAARIAGKLAVVDNKPEPKDVVSEVAPATETFKQPATEPVQPEPAVHEYENMNPVAYGQYIPKMKGWPTGKRLADVNAEKLKGFLQTAKDFVATNAQAGQEWKDFIRPAEEYVHWLDKPVAGEAKEPAFDFEGPSTMRGA